MQIHGIFKVKRLLIKQTVNVVSHHHLISHLVYSNHCQSILNHTSISLQKVI